MRYRDFKNDTWEDFFTEAENKKVILFAYNATAQRIMNEQKINVYSIVDNDTRKQGGFCKRVEIQNPNVLRKIANEVVVLICSTRIADIACQLEEMGIKNYYAEWWLSKERVYYEEQPDYEKINALKLILADKKSKEILDAIVEKRKNAFMDYTDIESRNSSEYFLEEFWNPIEDEVFIDGGGYNGDSIEEFVTWTNNKFKKIYSFEPQSDRALELRKKIRELGVLDRVDFYELGLWSEETELKFKNGDDNWSGTILGAEHDSIIKTCAVDNIVDMGEKITFVKMDIEGAEIEALYGAKNHILRDRPRMAICIYHKIDDLWEIPALIHKWLPDYELFIRHYGMRCYGTILYARPRVI